MGGGEVYTRFWWGNLKEKDQLLDPGLDGRIILRCSLCSFGNFSGVRSIKADVSELNVGSIVLGYQFRNVGFYTSDAGEIPKRTQTTF